jgi:hypothetical protein
MEHKDRVLVRRGARDLKAEEVEKVSGGLRTLTLCTCCVGGKVDGDISEC